MEAPKMLMLLVVLFVSSALSDQFSEGMPVDENQQPNAKSSSADNDDQNCITVTKNQPPVTLVISTRGHSLKRLVIYLYQDTESNKLQMYVPNKVKQVQFPDLGSGDGDLTTVESETVVDLFNANHNTVPVESPQQYITDIDTTGPPVEADPDESSEVVTTPKTVVPNSVMNLIPVETSQFQNNFNQNDNMTPILDQHPNQVPTNENVDVFRINELNPNLPDRFSFPIVKIPLVDLHSSSHPSYNSYNGMYPKLPQSSVPVPATAEYSGKFYANSAPPGYSVQNVYGPVNQQPINEDMKILLQTLDQKPSIQSNSQWHPISNVNYVQPDDRSTVNVNNRAQETHLNEYVTFDKWFTQQMQKIQKMGTSPNKNIDLRSLKNLIEKALYENGLYVTKDGVLTDSKANALNVANLKLRPFLIGDSVTYNNIFSVNQGDKYELPSNLPYLESVLVTLIDPPKILGVIPLGKTFVPRISYRAGLDYWAWKARNNMGECRTWECKEERMNQYKLYQSVNTKNRKSVKPPKNTDLAEESTPVKDSENSKEKTQESPVKVAFKHSVVKRPRQKYQYRVNFDNILQAVQSFIFNGPNKSKFLDFHKQKNTDRVQSKKDGDNESPDKSSKEDEEGKELPGFRIIGGLPATSSGTPVNSKGRSASKIF